MMCNKEPLMEPELYILEEKKNLISVKKLATEKINTFLWKQEFICKENFPQKNLLKSFYAEMDFNFQICKNVKYF